MKIFEGLSRHQAEDFSVVTVLGVAEVESLYTGDLVNRMNPEVGLLLSRTFSEVGIEGNISDVMLVVVWVVVVVFMVDFLKGL